MRSSSPTRSLPTTDCSVPGLRIGTLTLSPLASEHRLPGRRGRCPPRPSQIRTRRFPPSGSPILAGSYVGFSHPFEVDDMVQEYSTVPGFFLASSAIQCHFVNRFAGSMSPPVFPDSGSLHVAPPSPPSGPTEHGSPLSPVL